MTFIRISTVITSTVLLTALSACNRDERAADSPADSTAIPSPPPVSLPGTITGPDSCGIETEIDITSEQAVILYYWLPLDGYVESEPDLIFLSELKNTSVLPIPLQFDSDSRNHAQTVINNFNISLTVFLADSSILDYISPDMLPLTLLLIPGEETRETGFGGPERLLIRAGISF